MKQKRVPQIRFKGFEEEWEETLLNKWLTPSKEKNTDNFFDKENVLSVSGDFGVVNQIEFQGRSFAGVSVSNYGVVHRNEIVYTKSPLRKAPYGIIKTNKGISGIVSTLYAIYKCSEYTCPDFIQDYFNLDERLNNYLRPLVRKGAKNDMKISAGNALKGTVYFPLRLEQESITQIFSLIEHQNILHQSKLVKLRQLKHSMLTKMFPKAGSATPEIRFKGFEGKWEEKKLGDCFDERQERSAEGELISVTINSGIRRTIELDRHNSSSEDKSHYKRVEIGDIAYNSMRMWQGASGYSPYRGILSPAYTVVIPKGEIESEFFAYMFKKSDLIYQFRIHSQGLTSDTWNLKYPAFSKIVIRKPIVGEQKQIANFFRSLDRLITLHQQELEKLKNLKTALLQKMFV